MTSPFRERQMNELRFRRVTLAAREWLTPDYVRVRLEGDELEGFTSPGCDDHMRLFFPGDEAESVEDFRAAPSREYTPLAWGDNWLDVEFAVHGDEGIAAPWAAKAPLGSRIGVGGPRGSAVFSREPGAWFLAGDETAIPAIRRFAALAGNAPLTIVIEVPDAAHEVPLDLPVQWLHRGTAAPASALETHFSTLADAPSDDTFCFIAAEQQIVKPARALLTRWGVDIATATVKGYWKGGEAEYHAPH